MQESRPRGEDSPESDSGAENGFISRLLKRLRSTEQDDENEESAEPGQNKKSKRWQKLFSKVFGNIVQNDQIKNVADKKPENKDMSSSLPSDAQLSPGPEQYSGIDSLRTDRFTAQDPERQPVDLSVQPAEDLQVSTIGEPEYIDSGLGVLENSVHEQAGTSTHGDPHMEEYQEDEPNSDMPQGPTIYGRQSERIFYDRERAPDELKVDDNPTRSTEKNTGNSNRRGMAVLTGLLGVEYFARKRADRKLRQEIKSTENKSKSAQERLLQQVRVANDKLDQAPTPPMFFETRRPTSVAASEQNKAKPGIEAPTRNEEYGRSITMREGIGKKEPRSNIAPDAEKSKTIKPESLPRMELLDPVINLESLRRDNVEFERVIMEKVADAAEHNVPIEKHYERRHEVKDASTKIASNAASVSSIISQMGAQSTSTFSNTLPHSIPTSDTKSISPNDSTKHTLSNDAYKQAMKNGFWTAIIILITILVIEALAN